MSFRGGVHPPEKKELSENKPIEKMPPPSMVIIPVIQHIGAPAEPCVEVGESVKVGQKIAEPKAFVSVPSHASISGTVKSIDKMAHPVGGKVLSIVIEGDGNDDMLPDIKQIPDYMQQSVEEMRDRIKQAGIAGMGGAAFPTHVKLSPPAGKPIDKLILNGAECEPYLTSDARLMLEHPNEIIEGMKIFMKILDCHDAYIGIENNKPEAIRIFQKLAKEAGNNFQVIGLNVKYPQGAEKQLIKAITNRDVPAGGLPMDVGCLVQNVGTAKAVYEAVSSNKPFYERVVSVTGEGIQETKNVLVRVGTTFGELIEFCGGLKDDALKIINGGPMMGIAQFAMDVPVIKGTSGIVVLSEKQSKLPAPQPCIGCARCVDSCPMSLMPNYLAALVEHKRFDDAHKNGVLDCIECGCCSYVCPSKIRHVHLFKFGKLEVNKKLKSAA
ncbi:electron transport complex subunit RsxC [candidate division KSB1 bacterium]|nr:electron transport complex subunit RsxC [candidate division KSB1 bacterium]